MEMDFISNLVNRINFWPFQCYCWVRKKLETDCSHCLLQKRKCFFVNSARSFYGHSMSVYSTRLSTMRYLSLILLWRNDQMSKYSLSFLNIWAYLYQANLCNWISLSRLRFVLHSDNWYRCLNVMQFLIDKNVSQNIINTYS